MERAQSKVVGRFYMDRGVAILEAEDKRLSQSIVLEPESVAHFKPQSGQVIVAEIETYPEAHRPAVAKLIEVLGRLCRQRYGNRNRCAQAPFASSIQRSMCQSCEEKFPIMCVKPT